MNIFLAAFVLNQLITVQVAVCTDQRTAVEVASVFAEDVSKGIDAFDAKDNCAVLVAPLTLKRVVDVFETSEGTLLVIEALYQGEKLYVLTTSKVQGVEAI